MMGIPLRIVEKFPGMDAMPGDMWRYPDGDIDGRECWWIALPNRKPDAPWPRGTHVSWRTTDRASAPPHERWAVTGTAPNLTVSPSIDVAFYRHEGDKRIRDGSYWHGHIRNGELIDA